MHKFIFKIFLSFSVWVTAQDTKIKILNICDATTKANIENVYLISGEEVFFLENGKLTLDKAWFSIANKCIQISHVAYGLHEICELKDTIFISPKISDLNEVVVVGHKKNKSSKLVKLKPKATLSNLNPRNYGSLGYSLKGLKAIKIPVPKNQWIKNIKIYTNNVGLMNDKNTRSHKQKFTENAPFLYNILAFNDTIGIPANDFYFDSFHVCNKEVGSSFIQIEMNRSFNSEIVLVFKPLKKEDYKRMGFFSAPFIETIGVGNKTDFTPFDFDSQKNIWIKDVYLINRFQTYKIEVEYYSD
jgi:hypothetical protein